jgi:hypothetical protein
MNVRIFVAVLIAAVPAYAQAQTRSTPKVGDAQKVVTIIRGDKAKIQAYWDIQKLALQIEEASKKKDHGKTVNELYQKIKTLEETLGPEYVACRWASGHRERRPARCGVRVRNHSTRRAVCEVGLKNPKAPGGHSRY